jgi:deoxyadenosine/deoxycytidine kinase
MCRSEMEKLPSNFHVAIEGNIGARKTTLLQGLKKWFSKNNIRANVLPEPVKEWVKFGKTGINYLGLQYSDPKNYSLQFQLVATITKLWKGDELPITMALRGSSGSARIRGHVKS